MKADYNIVHSLVVRLLETKIGKSYSNTLKLCVVVTNRETELYELNSFFITPREPYSQSEFIERELDTERLRSSYYFCEIARLITFGLCSTNFTMKED